VSAPEETGAAGSVKSTQGSSRLPVGDATRTLSLPHLPYGDAVHAALAEFVMLPDTFDAGVRTETVGGRRELFLSLEWLPGHDDLVPPAVQAEGMTVQWSPLVGWSVRSGDDVAFLGVDELADPAVIAEAAMHAALCGIGCTCVKAPGARARWSEAACLDTALAEFDERPARS
jgi:hypothetical protein